MYIKLITCNKSLCLPRQREILAFCGNLSGTYSNDSNNVIAP